MKIGSKTGYFWTISFTEEGGAYTVTDGMIDPQGRHVGEITSTHLYTNFEKAIEATQQSHKALRTFLRDLRVEKNQNEG